jgi:ribosome biogenesis GTPase A
VNIQWYPGHMAKAKKLIKENLNLVDVVLEVVDARIPRSSSNPDINHILRKKPRVIALNKQDLAEERATKEWIKYYRLLGYNAASVNGVKKQGIKNLVSAIKVQAEPVLKELEKKGRRRRAIRVMVIGIPNSGKSTIINALVDKTTVKTANKPGVTRGPQWVRAIDGIELLDTPGLLWPKFDNRDTGFKLAATGAISDLVFSLEEVVRDLVDYLMKTNPEGLMERYKVSELFEDSDQNIEVIGRKRGLLASGGVVKMDQTSIMILQEFRNGKLGRYTLELPENNYHK